MGYKYIERKYYKSRLNRRVTKGEDIRAFRYSHVVNTIGGYMNGKCLKKNSHHWCEEIQILHTLQIKGKHFNISKERVNMKKKKEISIIRSSAAEYLTFITATGESDVNAVYFEENVWLTQKMMGLLYNVETHTINYHLKKIFADGELEETSVIRKFRITASDGKSYNTNHYNLKAIIAVGNKVDSPRAVQFRKWANSIIEEFTIKGYTMDDERLKNFGTVLTKDYFEEQLQRVREIRLSERRFYQKITDIYATSIDYDPKAQTTRLFFARVQNQLHWAIHGETAAEVIYHRADNQKEHMGLQTWKDAPNGRLGRAV